MDEYMHSFSTHIVLYKKIKALDIKTLNVKNNYVSLAIILLPMAACTAISNICLGMASLSRSHMDFPVLYARSLERHKNTITTVLLLLGTLSFEESITNLNTFFLNHLRNIPGI